MAGEDQEACVSRRNSASKVPPAASGDEVGVPPPRHTTQGFCSSQNRFTLLRGVTCQVKRRLAFFQVPSLMAGRVRSGS